MYKSNKVSLYNKTTGKKDEHGIYISGELELIKIIYCDIQPFSTELLLKEYGYNIQVTKRIFMDLDNEIIIGSILKTDTESLEVRKIIEWDNFMEVMCFAI